MVVANFNQAVRQGAGFHTDGNEPVGRILDQIGLVLADRQIGPEVFCQPDQPIPLAVGVAVEKADIPRPVCIAKRWRKAAN